MPDERSLTRNSAVLPTSLAWTLRFRGERSPLKRNVKATEVGNTALFLVSDLSSGITGETIYVDCGYNIMGI